MAISKTAQDFKQVDNDLYFSPTTGDLVIAESDNQHIQDILQSEPGWYKEFPQVGASVRKLLKARINVQKVTSLIKQQLEADGYQVNQPTVSINANGKTIVNPRAKRIRFE